MFSVTSHWSSVPTMRFRPLVGTALLLALSALASSAQGPAGGRNAAALKTLSLEELGSLKVVTETKEPTDIWHTPSAIYVLTGDEIRRSGVTSVPDALRLVPGVNVA